MSKADIGLVGLAVMGENLILNMESKGFTVIPTARAARLRACSWRAASPRMTEVC